MIQVATHPTPRGYMSARTLPHAQHIFGTVEESGWVSIDDSIRRATERLGPIAHMAQVHSNRVTYAHTSGLYTECDALYTDKPDLWLAVKTADCVPVLISSPDAVAAVHAGWRGLESEILAETIATLTDTYGLDATDLHVAIGPCICQQHYEVDGSFANIFPEKFLRESETEGKLMLDVAGLAAWQVQQAGVLDFHIQTMNRCTFEEEGVFYSHRRAVQTETLEGNGRQLSLIKRA